MAMNPELNKAEPKALTIDGNMNTEDRIKGFDSKDIAYLVGMCQDVYAPSDFDLEVQRYLDALSERQNEKKASGSQLRILRRPRQRAKGL
jgi:hypothetical protein